MTRTDKAREVYEALTGREFWCMQCGDDTLHFQVGKVVKNIGWFICYECRNHEVRATIRD